MITLGQIHLLEEKIEEVLKRLQSLEEENKTLLDKNNALKKEKENLAYRISTFEADQEQIEKGILNALDKLNTIESAVIKEKKGK
jgi:regulator of replication initiation timing